MLSVIDWGIPNSNHPFNYQMDEWHQLQAIRSTFENFSPNISGSAHGTMFHFILSGLYLIPFYLLGIINPFAIRSSTELLQVQQRLFEILRLSTLIFGFLSIFFIAKIAKDHLRINQNIAVILFVVTPLWLSLSNYFKYDIALVLWIILSLYFLLKFGSKPNLRNYLTAGVFCALGVATKISSLPLLLIYIVSFFWFSKKIKMKNIFLGLLVFSLIVIFLGIPDLIMGKGNYKEFLYSNLVLGSNGYGNLVTGFSTWWQYLLLRIFPMDFGYGFLIVYMCAISYWIALFMKQFSAKKLHIFKNEFFLLFCFLIFTASIIPLKLGANGNRLLVLLPFFALLTSAFIQKIKLSLFQFSWCINLILILVLAIQSYQSMIMIYVKWLPDVREISSIWMRKNLARGALIGIENIPIYQLLPDIVVKEFYLINRRSNNFTNFNYKVIDASSDKLPPILIITNKNLELLFFKNSAKKQLIYRLEKEGYKAIVEFKSQKSLYLFFGNELNFFTSGLAPIPAITIFMKDKKNDI